MPRDGSGVYSLNPGWPATTNTTIESPDWNAFINDMATDANAARPIIAGGTSATTATAARSNLQTQVKQQVVTNYDSQVWEDGSFFSAAGATSAPSANGIVGTALVFDANTVVLEAYDPTTGKRYQRVKSATWGAWSDITPGNYVLKTGDVMTGSLTLAPTATNALLIFNKANNTLANYISASNAGSNRWLIALGDNSANEDVIFYRYANDGSFLGTPLYINRLTGNVGIGITTPANYGAGWQNVAINGQSGGGANIDLLVAGTRFGIFNASATGVGLASVTAIPLIFYTNIAERMRIDGAGNVGIGTSSPAAPFAVMNSNVGIEVIPAAGAPYGAVIQGVSRTSGFAYNAMTLVGNPLLLNALGGGSVGIGTTTPAAGVALTVNGTGLFVGQVRLQNAYARFEHYDAGGNLFWVVGTNNDGLYRIQKGAQAGAVSIENSDLTVSGNVGIGTSTPGQKLEVNNGNIWLSNALSPTLYLGTTINTSAGWLSWDNSNAKLSLGMNASQIITMTNTGAVGIGTINPQNQFHATGIMRTDSEIYCGFGSGSSGIIRFGNINSYLYFDGTNCTLHNQTDGHAFQMNMHQLPLADNTYLIGASGQRWSAVWAANGTIQTSDERFKTDIEESDLGLAFIKALRPIKYREKAEKEAGIEALRYGLSAQQIIEVMGGKQFSGIVHDEDADMYGLNYAALVTPLITAMQELTNRVEGLEGAQPKGRH